MKSQCCWLIFTVLSCMSQAEATTYNSEPYALPPTKAYLDSCQKKALQLHQGRIEKQQVLHRDGRFILQYEIQVDDGTQWIVQCDLETGQMIGE